MFSIDPKTALFCSFLVGSLSAYLAHRQGKNPYKWFLIGFLFGTLGIIAIFLAPKSKRTKKLPVPKPEPRIVGPRDKFWYYLDADHQQMGPVSFVALNRDWKEGKLPSATFVWHEELPNWKPLHELIQH